MLDRDALETGTERMHTERQPLPEDAASETAVRLATFDQYRGLLFSVAYRMLGSVADAEDMLQESFIRWQQAGDETVRSPRSFSNGPASMRNCRAPNTPLATS